MGWGVPGGLGAAKFADLSVDVAAPSAVVLVSSFGPAPIATSNRLLVTAVGRVEPTGFRYTDEWRREPGEPGRPPLLHEGVAARITWKHAGKVQAYALDTTGARLGPVRLEQAPGDAGIRLDLDGRTPSLYWELVVE